MVFSCKQEIIGRDGLCKTCVYATKSGNTHKEFTKIFFKLRKMMKQSDTLAYFRNLGTNVAILFNSADV